MSAIPPRGVPTPANPTKKYVPGTGVGGIGLAHVLDNKPWFTYWDIPRLQRDPFVSFLRRVWCSPLQGVKFKIKATSPEVYRTVDTAVKRYWKKALPALMRRYFLWGYAPAGVEYKVKRGRWIIDNIRPIEPRDARVKIFTNGSRQGEFAGFHTQTTGDVSCPYAFWFRGAGEFGGFYDIPPAASLWDSWTDYGPRGGARSIKRLFMRKHSISPAQIRYPEGETRWINDDGSETVINNKLLALQIAEYYESGANVVLPSECYENGKPKWELIPAEAKADANSVAEYPNDLKEEMSEAIGMPFEVIKAAETGSGYSGRSVPYKAWLGTMDEYAGLAIDSFDANPLRYLVRVNHGPKADYEIEPQSLVEQFEKMNQTTSDTGGQPPESDGGDEQSGGDSSRPAPQPTPPKSAFQMSQAVNFEATKEADKKDAKKRKQQAMLSAMAMLDLQIKAHEEGDPAKYQDQMDELAANRDDGFQMGWEPYEGPRGGRGFVNESGTIRYGGSKPGERRERAKADAKKAHELLSKIRWDDNGHEHLLELVDHLPAMTVDKLRYARQMLGAKFGNAKKRDEMIEALKGHAGKMAEETQKQAVEVPEEQPAAKPKPTGKLFDGDLDAAKAEPSDDSDIIPLVKAPEENPGNNLYPAVDNSTPQGTISGSGSQVASTKPEGGKMTLTRSPKIVRWLSDVSPGDKYGSLYFTPDEVKDLTGEGLLEKAGKTGKEYYRATDKVTAVKAEIPADEPEPEESKGHTIDLHLAKQNIGKVYLARLTGSHPSYTFERQFHSPEEGHGGRRDHRYSDLSEGVYESQGYGGKTGGRMYHVVEHGPDGNLRDREITFDQAKELFPKPVQSPESQKAGELAKAARDYRAGKVVSDDLIFEAVKGGYLTDGEAMNRDY